MKFIAIRSYDTYILANIMLQRLEQEGIKAYLQDEHSVTINPIFSNAIGGIKLMVHSLQAERALQLITEFEKAYNKAGACPKCGSENVQFIPSQKKSQGWLESLIEWFKNDSFSIRQVYHCYDCGNEFETLPQHPVNSDV